MDLKTYVDDAVLSLCDTLLSLQVGPSEVGFPHTSLGGQVVGMVGLAGSITAVVCLRVPEENSVPIAHAMLGPEAAGDNLSEIDVNDVIGELTNIIAGKLKSCLRRSSEPCNLSLPTIVRGRHIDLETMSGTHRSSFTFESEVGTFVLEYYSLTQEAT